jgi:hypothetical protein
MFRLTSELPHRQRFVLPALAGIGLLILVVSQQSWLQAQQINFFLWLYLAMSGLVALSVISDLQRRSVFLFWIVLGIIQCILAVGYWAWAADTGASYFLGVRRELVPSAYYVASGCNLLLTLVLYQILNRLTLARLGRPLEVSPRLRIALDQHRPVSGGKEWDVICSLILSVVATMSGILIAFLLDR